jgi:hypothetical protein
MSALEVEFYNLLTTSESRWTTLLIEGRTWANFDIQTFAWQTKNDRLRANGARIATFRRADSNENEAPEIEAAVAQVERDETWSLWVTPERRRAKFKVGDELVDVVIEGSTYWSNGHGRSITNGGNKNHSHGQGDGHNMIRTPDYAGLLKVMEISEGTQVGRQTIDAKAKILDDGDLELGPGLHGLTIGDADFLELRIDRERGVVLSASSWFQGIVYRILEVTNVEFDPGFASTAFRIEPEFGSEWTSAY